MLDRKWGTEVVEVDAEHPPETPRCGLDAPGHLAHDEAEEEGVEQDGRTDRGDDAGSAGAWVRYLPRVADRVHDARCVHLVPNRQTSIKVRCSSHTHTLTHR
jgi:hypothetical protein